jgi:hypothetical protein
MKNKIITISLESTSFTPDELMYIDDLGDPVVSFDKIYDTNFVVKFDKRLKSGFKLIQRFDGTANVAEAAAAANQFLEDIETEVGKIMADLRDAHVDLLFEEINDFIDITKY